MSTTTVHPQHRLIDPPFGNSNPPMNQERHAFPKSTVMTEGGRVITKNKSKRKVSWWRWLGHAMSFPMPMLFNRITEQEQTNDVMPADVARYIQHIETDLVSARTSYCEALLEMAKSRVEAQHQLVRYQEMQHILAMIRDADKKSVDEMKKELADYSGLKIIR